MKPSKYQQAVFNAVITTPSNIAVSATAGSGKTTTIVEAAKLIPYGKSAVFVAFGVSIVKELKERLPAQVTCSTMHSVGVSAIRKYYGEIRVMKDQKQIGFIKPLASDIVDNRDRWVTIYAVDRLMSLARATMSGTSISALMQVCENYALDIDDSQLKIASEALDNMYAYDEETGYNVEVDFQDMIEMCVRNRRIHMPAYDYVFVDEIQDLSALDHLFVNRLIKPITGRIIGVGDPRQSIYGFRGSDPNSFDKFAQQPNTTILPLSISYRCAKGIVNKAREIYQEIEPYENNEQGIVKIGGVNDIQEGDMVLCRNTRPLVDVFLRLIDNDKKAYVVGKDMEKGLLDIVDHCDNQMVSDEAIVFFDSVYQKVLGSLKAKGIQSPHNHPKARLIEEKLDILRLLVRRFEFMYQLKEFITTVFNDKQRDAVRLMTIHKSKGLENDTVFVIESFDNKRLIPSDYAVTKEQKVQETNLKFVAYTRAKRQLVLVYL
jgi:DNA helicase II / ATP-dependent DNA helicase PcrA